MSQPMSAGAARAEAIRRIESARAEGSEVLDLGDLPLASLPDELSGLTGLTVLALCKMKPLLRDGEITWEYEPARPDQTFRDLSPLAGLASLSRLDLSYWEVTDLSPLAGLASLSMLNLDHCDGLNDLSPLGNLASLSCLCLDGCAGVTDLSPLACLASLSTLSLSFCRGVTDLSPLAGLASLSWLHLDGCAGVTDLSPLAGLTSLRILHLDCCPALGTFVPLRSLLHRLEYLSLFDSQTDLPPEVCGESPLENVLAAVIAHYADEDLGRTADAELKVFVLGNGGVGKTRLCNAIRPDGPPFSAPVASTHGIELGCLTREVPGVETPVWLNLWDFGGQDVYHGAHALFMQDQAVFVILWHPEKEQGTYREGDLTLRHQPLAYWLDYVRAEAGTDVAVLVVQSQCEDAAQKRLPPVDAADWGFRYCETLQFSAHTGWGRTRLDACLEEATQAVLASRPARTVGVGRARVRDRLRQMQAEPLATRQRTLTVDEFHQLCRDDGKVSDPDALLDFLHKRGVVFHKRDLFGDRIVVDQSWALDAIYAVFHREKTLSFLRRQHGRFTREDLALRLWEGQGHCDADQKLFLKFMEGCGICFRARDLTPQQRRQDEKEWEYLAPDMLPAWGEAETKLIDTSAAPLVRLRYDFLHEGTLRRLLSTLGRQPGDGAIYWRYGCFLSQWGGKILVRSSWADPDRPRAGEVTFTAWGHWPEGGVAPLVAKLLSLSPAQKPEAILPPAVSQDDEKEKVYVSYAWGEDTTEQGRRREEVVDRLMPLLEQDGFVVMRDKDVMRHGDSIHKFMVAIGRGRRVVIILSDKYLRSRYCLFELHQVYARCGRNTDEFVARIAPAVLECARIYDPEYVNGLLRHWDDAIAGMSRGRARLSGSSGGALLEDVRSLRIDLPNMLAAIADALAPCGFDAIVRDDFADLRAMVRRSADQE